MPLPKLNFAGAVGAHADDKEAGELNEALVRNLLPFFDRMAEEFGWAAVLNALHTIVINVGARTQGIAQVEAGHRAALESLPRLAALIAAETSAGGRA